ncbi:HEAT repeat domain-containing protein [Streptomyces sp. SJL17-1]|uniref:HEAT repeat domain-containing protein n=1 Tax=Streptomyces sp. SJL17-1 TaxID=2967223 RepID=UPI00296613C6|nr:HEAT repeat domain-containing protein [Streptomyces sp. SJL17-1]
MINELDGIDWSAMSHAYGPAGDVPVWLRAMGSDDPDIRSEAFDEFYSAAHHQGDVYECTMASLPFLFTMADDPTAPDRASVVELLLSIGREAVTREDGIWIGPDGNISTVWADTAAVMRERADAFVSYASDAEPAVRRAAIEGLGFFLDDPERAVEALRGRLRAEPGIVERLMVVETMAVLALRLPAARSAAAQWLAALADEATTAPDIRLASLVHRTRCAPEHLTGDTVPTAIALLRRLTPGPQTTTRDQAGCRAGSGECACTPATVPAAPGTPPHIAAAFEDLERHSRLHAPTTSLLRTFHGVLDHRVPERTLLLTAQLRSPDPATRYDAIRMAQDLIGCWRGNHAGLVALIAECLLPADPYTAVAAAESLGSLVPVAGHAREALAAYIAAHEPDAWAAPHPLRRRAHQEAVIALARLGDTRALPGLLTALDTGIDAWRAIQVAGHLHPAAAELVPRLCRHLDAVDFSRQRHDINIGALTSALAELADTTAVPALTRVLTEAIRHEQWPAATSALEALTSFGTDAAPSANLLRPLADAEDVNLRAAAAAAWWALERDPAGVLPSLHGLLDTYRNCAAADVLALIGPPAASALPRLTELMTTGDIWTRLHAATAVWDIAGHPEADNVVQTLLEVWAKNEATISRIVPFLDRIGPAARPALPLLEAELAHPAAGPASPSTKTCTTPPASSTPASPTLETDRRR